MVALSQNALVVHKDLHSVSNHVRVLSVLLGSTLNLWGTQSPVLSHAGSVGHGLPHEGAVYSVTLAH